MSLYLQEFRLIFESTRDGVLAFTSRNILDANPAFCELVERTQDQLVQMEPVRLLTPESKRVLEHQARQRQASSGSFPPFDLVLVTGHEMLIPVSVRLVKSDSCMLLFVQDQPITSEAPTEVSGTRVVSREGRPNHHLLVEHLPDGLLTSNDSGRLTFVNSAFARLLGYSSQSSLVARRLLDLVTAEDRTRVTQLFGRWRRGEPARSETKLLHADGRVVPTLLSGCPMPPDAEGKSTGVVILVTDFAEQQALVEKITLTRQMEALSSLAGGIAHDFNNLLTGILGRASVIRARTDRHSEIGDLAHGIEESAELAARLTQRLLALVRGQAPHRHLLDVGVLVKETLQLLTRVIPEGIDVQTNIADGVPPALADESQLQQAILNLCINARDAMLDHSGTGVLKISVGSDWLNKPLDDGGLTKELAVALTITDNGPGVPEHLQQRIFDPFFTTKGLGRGMGLGLSTVYNLVDAHGGTVDVGHAPGGGAQFSVKLPAHPGKRAEPRPARTTEQPPPLLRGAGTVLLAEDETAIREMVFSTLEQQGYTVLAARDGRSAIELFEAHSDQIDLMLLDVRMPYVDGTEVLRHVRTRHPDMPAVLSSGFVPEEHESAPDMPSNVLFLPKPYRMPELLLTVGRAMAGPPTGEFDEITHPTPSLAISSAEDTDHGSTAPAGLGFDPARTLTE